MGRSPCCSKEGLNRGAWTAQEDKILTEFISLNGEGRWRNLPKRAGLKRCGKSCRLRWLNYLRPDIKRGNISSDEEDLIIRLHKLLGNRWSLIAGRLPGRTDNEIKNYWNTNLSKKVNKNGKQKTTDSYGRNSTQNSILQLGTMATPSPSLTPKQDSLVIRTKATKCSKMLFINPNSSPTMQLMPNNFKAEAVAEATTLEDTVACNSSVMKSNKVLEPTIYDNGFLSSPGGGEEIIQELSTEWLMDFDVDDIFLFDLLNSDSSNTTNFTWGNNDVKNLEQLPTFSDQPDPMFSAELLMDSLS